MKISRFELAALILTAAFLAFSVGWLARGRQDDGPVRIQVERAAEQELLLPEPSSSPPVETPCPAESGAPAGTDRTDINTADAEELQRLPGIGAARAEAIVEDREKNGPFRIPEDLTRVPGIGEGILEQCISHITVGEEDTP